MTTLVGIKTNHGPQHIVIASDRQQSVEEDEEKQDVRKIYYGKNWVIGVSGGAIDDKALTRFFGMLKGDKRYRSSPEIAERMIKNALERKVFYEVNELNRRVAKRDRSIDGTYRFLFATNSIEFGLWEIDEFGNMLEPPEENEFEYFCLGSGGEKAKRYIGSVLKEGVLNGKEIDKETISVDVAIPLAKRAVQSAEEDLSTGFGYDLIIVPQNVNEKIDWLGGEIKQRLKNADLELERDIIERYKKKISFHGKEE